MTDRTKPVYMIGVVAEMLKVHPQTLRFYEKKGLVRPGRTEGQTRMYSDEDLVGYVRESGGEAAGATREPREALVRAASNQLKPLDLF